MSSVSNSASKRVGHHRRGARRVLIAALVFGGAGLPTLGGAGPSAPDVGSVESVVARAESAHRSTLREVLARNPELARLRAEADAAEAAIDGAASWPEPMASLTAFARTPETRVGSQRWNFSIQQRFPWFGKLGAREKQAASSAVAARLSVDVRALELVTAARVLLWELAFLDEQQSILEADRDTLLRYEELARARYASGVGLQQAVIKLQAEVTRLEERLVDVDARRRSLRARLAALRGGGAFDAVPLAALGSSSEWPTPTLEELTTAAWGSRPEVGRTRASLEATDAALELAHKEYRPDWSVGVAYTAVSGRDDAPGRLMPPEGNGDDVLGVSVSAPLPVRRRRLSAGVETASARRLAVEEGLQILEVSFEAELGDLLARLEGARRQLDLIEGLLLVQAEESLRSAEVAYAAGSVSALDLLDAERTLLNARLSAARLRADLWVTLTKIEGASGAPLPTPSETRNE